jgi:hypothetical protein
VKALRASTIAASLLFAAAAAAFGASPSVVIYPSGLTVPENLLRIELRFSLALPAPLSIDHVKLFDAGGREIESAFLDASLPSADLRRVTILLHPARVKSGVGANLLFGRALHVGSVVTLVVDHPALAKPVRKTWRVAAFDAEPPQPTRWTFEPPRRGSRSPIVIQLDAPICSSAEALIAIRGPDGRRLDGTARLEDGETVWRFLPSRPWRAGSHAVVTHQDIEDPAGNRPCAPFELIDASRVRCEEGTAQPFEVVKQSKQPGARTSSALAVVARRALVLGTCATFARLLSALPCASMHLSGVWAPLSH